MFNGYSVQAADNPFGWDLSYKSVFKDADVPENDTMLKYFVDSYQKEGQLKSMALPENLFSNVDLSAIKRAILIDNQAFWFMGHRMSTLYLDYGDSVVARSYNSKQGKVSSNTVQPEYFISFANAILSRSQSVPAGGYAFEVSRGYSFSGYIGAISTYEPEKSRQWLLTKEDLFIENMQVGELGKLMRSLQRKMRPKE
ncbi:MAG TPA: hypothetical protein ENJ08_14090 [Gammaproteobacteria bacterium]|nr:hypothetical protein [Gammaproteobacteria bacterium]